MSCSPDTMQRGIERQLTSIARVPSPAHDGQLKTYHAIVRVGLFASVRTGPAGNWWPTKSAAIIWRRCSLASPMSARPPLPISKCGIGPRLSAPQNETLGRPYGSRIQDQERNRKAFEESTAIMKKCWTEPSFSHHGESRRPTRCRLRSLSVRLLAQRLCFFESSTSMVLLTEVPVGMRTKASISLL